MFNKRGRNVNFTTGETGLLFSLVKAKKDIIESKRSDEQLFQEKEAAWKWIENEFNKCADVYRDAKCLKHKYECLNKDIKKKEIQIRESITSKSRTNSKKKFTSPLGAKKTDNCQIKSDQAVPDTSTSCTPRSHFSGFPPPKNQRTGFQPPKNPRANGSDFQSPKSTTAQSNSVVFHQINQKPSNLNPATEGHLPSDPKLDAMLNNLNKRKIGDNKFSDAKYEVIALQKQRVLYELEKELTHAKLLKQEIEHKQHIQELEKRHLLLKIELTELELANAKKACSKKKINEFL